MALIAFVLSFVVPVDFSQPWDWGNSGFSVAQGALSMIFLSSIHEDWRSVAMCTSAFLANGAFGVGVIGLLLKARWLTVGFAIAALLLSWSSIPLLLLPGLRDLFYSAPFWLWEGSMVILLVAAIGGVRRARSSLAIAPPVPDIERSPTTS
jgi:hypothetical protein